MSAKDRAIAKSVNVDDGELSRLFRSIGKGVPTWINKSYEQNQKVGRRLWQAFNHLDGIEFLLSTTTPHKEDLEDLLKSKDLFERFIEGCYQLDNLPKQAPKHRDALVRIYEEAFALVEPIRKAYTIYGDTPKNLPF